jgi:hypothetical protein
VFTSFTPQNKPHAKNGYAIICFAHPPPYSEKESHIDKEEKDILKRTVKKEKSKWNAQHITGGFTQAGV